MAKPATSPIKITIHLADGRLNSADGIIMFDAILYHAWFAKYAPHVLDGNGDDNYDGYTGLPLRQLPGNRWAASKGIYTEVSQSIEHINKRPDFFAPPKSDYLGMDKGIISDSVGLYRAYRIPAVIRTVKDGLVTFWAMGHKDAVLDLLSYLPALGKKPAAGYGIIDSYTVEDCDDDYSLVHPEYGLMRPAPVEDGVEYKGYPIMRYSVKPPYWKPKNMRLCYVPI